MPLFLLRAAPRLPSAAIEAPLRRVSVAVCAAAGLFACGGDGGSDPGTTTADVRPTADAGPSTDAQTGGDAHPLPPDARALEDAAPPLADRAVPVPDAAADAQPLDGRVADLGTPADAQAADAVTADATASVDVAVAADATPPLDAAVPADALAGADALAFTDAALPCQCGPEERCHPVTLVCEPIVPCEAHSDCGEGFCVDRICEVAVPGSCECAAGWTCRSGRCEMPGPCGEATLCPEETFCGDGSCGFCRDNLDCPGQTRCLSGTCREPQTCFGDDFCLGGRACAAEGYCTPNGQCVEDVNGDLGAPDRALSLGFEARAGLMLCEGTNDWFLITVDAPASVAVLREPTLPPLTLELYPAEDPFSARDYDLGRTGVTWVSAPAGRWLVRVSAPPGAGGPYALDVRAACVEDAHERPWRNDTVAGATSLSVGQTSGTLCADDVDHFLYRGPESGSVRLEAAGGMVSASVAGRPLPADLVAGDVVEVRGDVGARYRLVTERRRDPVHRCAEAPELPLATPTEIFVLGGADDFTGMCSLGDAPDGVWRVHLDAPSALTVTLPGAPPNAALAVHRDCAQAPIHCVAGAERLLLPEQPAGDYYIVVEGPATGRLTVSAGGGGGVCALAGQARLGFDTPVEIPAGPGGVDGGCLDPARSQVALRFTLPITSQVTLRTDAGGRDVTVAIRGVCDDSLTEQACQAGPDSTVVADRLVAGEYIALVEGVSGPVVVHLDAVPVP